MGIGECCHDPGPCPIAPHSATGWCLASTGAPVLLIVTFACPPGDPTEGVTVTLIDADTGEVLPPQEVRPCNNRDWEVNQLCDYDSLTGELIATFVQMFVWDEQTGILTVSLVRADDPNVPYVPVGDVRNCDTDETDIDVEVTEFCYDPAGGDTLAKGWQAWIFADGVYVSTLYFDATGTPLVAPVVIECPDPATEATLAAVLGAVQDIDANTDGLEACCAAGNALLTAIEGNTDDLEAYLASIDGHVDGLEACCAASNALLTAIDASLNTIEGAVHNEDDPHVSGHAGIAAWGVRNDANAALTSADGDYSPIATDSAGRVKIAPVTASKRKIDGKSLSGAGAIVIPDNVVSWTVTVNNKGTSTTVTGPSIVGPWTLFSGQTVSHAADDNNDGSNLLEGPITITTVGAAAEVNASWVKP